MNVKSVQLDEALHTLWAATFLGMWKKNEIDKLLQIRAYTPIVPVYITKPTSEGLDEQCLACESVPDGWYALLREKLAKQPKETGQLKW